ncbi:LCP family protein [Desulfitobacterium metallireducens]|uniref:LCP family protein n=1 Tax=Desulfitobacterium metallireducens TaxID=142877 RepID=UPI000318209E|nr:LCP family protein [Desulfitobacterium metallireducens]
MKLNKLGLGILLSFGMLGISLGAFYWKGQTHDQAMVVYQPSEVALGNEEEEKGKSESPVPKEKGRVNILLLGIDNKGDEPGRADSIILVSANSDTHQISAISIPRDTRVSLPEVGLTKITHANVVGELKGGIDEGTLETVKAVSNLLEVDINYYLKINFKGFEKVVDAIGGIDVSLPSSVNDRRSNLHLSAGEHHLSGEEALVLVQARYDLPDGDFGRQQNQFYVVQSLANQMLAPSNIPELPKLITTIRQDLLDTNMSIYEMVTLGVEFKGIDKEAMKYYQLPGKGISALDPLVGAVVYYYEPNKDGVKKVIQEAFER